MTSRATPVRILVAGTLAIAALGVSVAGAAEKKKPTGTIKDLENRTIQIDRDPPANVQPQQAIEQYKKFLDLQSDNEKMRAEAMRLLAEGLPAAVDAWQDMLVVIAALSMIVGNVVAIAQTNIKRMLAYSSIAHAGYTLMGIVAGSTFKGVIAGLIVGLVAQRTQSLAAIVGTGLVVGAFFAYLVTPGGPYFWEIILPGSIVGLIVGFATAKYRGPSRVRPAGGGAS